MLQILQLITNLFYKQVIINLYEVKSLILVILTGTVQNLGLI